MDRRWSLLIGWGESNRFGVDSALRRRPALLGEHLYNWKGIIGFRGRGALLLRVKYIYVIGSSMNIISKTTRSESEIEVIGY
jgi:hypothetical protein